MQVGLFTREGRRLVGRIGDLILAWDRHEGGKLSVSRLVAGEPVQSGNFTMNAQLEGASLCSAADPDPRLILVEAGPHRLVLRAVQRLYDADGIHQGDAMQEAWAWADGSLYLNAMLRLINSGHGGRFIEAAARFEFANGWTSVAGEGIRLVHEGGSHLAALSYGDGGTWAVPASVEDSTPADVNQAVWERVDGGPPFYRVWGPYYEQWGAAAGGWSTVTLEDGPILRAVWAAGELRQRDRGSTEAFKGTLALVAAGNEAALERKVHAFEHPLDPSVEGGKALYHSIMEGTTVIRKTAERLKVKFPADPDEREARLHIRFAGERGVLDASGASSGIGFPLTHGGVADDPNGPNLVRPDDPHGPILTDADLRPDEVITTVPLAADREVEVELASGPGIWMASQKWDERQNLLLFSAAHPQGNLGEFCLRDLKMRDLKIPGYADPIMARLPLYWFQANANSAHHCLNHPKAVDLIENGPDAVHFRVVAQNPAATAESDIDVRIPFLQDQLRFDMVCRFTALEDWDLNGIQYCNFFPEEQRYPEKWGSDRVLVMAGDGQRTLTDHRGAGESRILSGEQFMHYEGDLFLALYGGPRGNILVLSRARKIDQAQAGYQLCECWLDNHLFVTAQTQTIAAGTSYEVEMSLVLAQTTNIDEDLEALGRQALESGELAL
jgi:hypothetical protein